MHRALAVLLLATGCGGGYSAVEDVGDADLRVVASFSARGDTIVALAGDAPFRKDLAEGERVELWVFAYTLESLSASYPALAGKSATEVAALLAPRIGGASPGFTPPRATRVLSAVVDGDSGSPVAYLSRTWADWLEAVGSGDKPAFTLGLSADVGCPLAGRGFRLFSPSRPGAACGGKRSATCGWKIDASCEQDLRSICRYAPSAGIVELPSGVLQIAGAECEPQAVDPGLRGISSKWACGADACGSSSVLAVQDDAIARDGATWAPRAVPEDQIHLSELGLQPGGAFTRVAGGALYAYDTGSGHVRVHRFEMTRRVRMGVADAFDSPNDGALKVSGTVLAINKAWTGAPSRLTANAATDFIVVHGADGTAVSARDTAAQEGFGYLTPRRVPSNVFTGPTALAGEVVASRRGRRIYAAVASGVAVLDETAIDRIASSTQPGSGPVLSSTSAHRLTVVESSGADVIVSCRAPLAGAPEVALCAGDRVYLYDDKGTYLHERRIEGDLLAIGDGLRAIVRTERDGFVLEVCDLSRGDCTGGGVRYVVPAPSAAEVTRVSVGRDAVISIGGREMVAYTAGDQLGVLDLETGSSAALGGRGKGAPIAFENVLRSQVWVIGTDPARSRRFDRVGFSLLGAGGS